MLFPSSCFTSLTLIVLLLSNLKENQFSTPYLSGFSVVIAILGHSANPLACLTSQAHQIPPAPDRGTLYLNIPLQYIPSQPWASTSNVLANPGSSP